MKRLISLPHFVTMPFDRIKTAAIKKNKNLFEKQRNDSFQFPLYIITLPFDRIKTLTNKKSTF